MKTFKKIKTNIQTFLFKLKAFNCSFESPKSIKANGNKNMVVELCQILGTKFL